jgi:hypothetical protein
MAQPRYTDRRIYIFTDSPVLASSNYRCSTDYEFYFYYQIQAKYERIIMAHYLNY